MRIVLICMGGITTNILGHKMTAYLRECGRDDEIVALSLAKYESDQVPADVVLIAPQAKNYVPFITEKALQMGSGIVHLRESDLIQPDMEALFEAISLQCKAKQTGKAEREEMVTGDRDAGVKHAGKLLKIYKKSFLWITPIFLLLLFLKGCTLLNPEFSDVYRILSNWGGFCVIYILGYKFGEEYGYSPLACAFACITCVVMVLSAFENMKAAVDIRKFVFHLSHLPVIVLSASAVGICYIIVGRLGYRLLKLKPRWNLSLEAVYISIVMLIFFLLRLLILLIH